MVISTMPTPRTSSLPAIVSGARASEAPAVLGEHRIIVADEARAAIDQAQREIGLAAARRPPISTPRPADRDAGGVERVSLIGF